MFQYLFRSNSAFKRRLAKYTSNTRGNVAVEFAMLGPIFTMMLLGIMVFGIYFGAAHSVQQLAADAARASVAGLSAAERQSLAQATVNNSVAGYSLIKADKLVITTQANASDPNLFEVKLTYDASSLGIWGASGLIPFPSSTIQRTAVIRRGGY